MKVSVSIDIPFEPSAVWDELEQLEQHVTWMTEARRLTFTGEQRRGIGTEIVVETKVGPFRTLDHMRFTEWSAPTVMGVEHRGLFVGRGKFTLDPIGRNATKLTWIEQIRFPWYLGANLGAFAARPILRRIWAGNLQRLGDRLSSR
jgi:carbon monoxide dehydrogenase subunit G